MLTDKPKTTETRITVKDKNCLLPMPSMPQDIPHWKHNAAVRLQAEGDSFLGLLWSGWETASQKRELLGGPR